MSYEHPDPVSNKRASIYMIVALAIVILTILALPGCATYQPEPETPPMPAQPTPIPLSSVLTYQQHGPMVAVVRDGVSLGRPLSIRTLDGHTGWDLTSGIYSVHPIPIALFGVFREHDQIPGLFVDARPWHERTGVSIIMVVPASWIREP